MGTEITLSLNGIDIDWGKNEYWKGHYWLFPAGSFTQIEYIYAGDLIEIKPGLEASLSEVLFRLRNLGYSSQEARASFDEAVLRWNRTADLRLTFADFQTVLTAVDFASLTRTDLEPFLWDFRRFMVHLLAPWDTEDAGLEDFVFGLDFAITLRTLADREDSGPLLLRWHYQDLVDSGWTSLEDLTEIDRRTYIINHTNLAGRLQQHSGATSVTAFDNWLVQRGLPQTTPYVRQDRFGAKKGEVMTLPTAVRNMIHHPENPNNTLSNDSLRESVELLLGIAKRLPTPLLDLS